MLNYTDVDLARFWGRVDKTDTCWFWTYMVNNWGYGIFQKARKTQAAHRVAYELVKGPIPEGLDLDHLCRNRTCVNPDHLEPVTRRINVLRGVSFFAMRARQTHCHNGHEFTEENIYRHPKTGCRDCRACRKESNRRYSQRKRDLG